MSNFRYVNLSISVIRIASGEEIYKGSVGDVKGIDVDYESAGLKALENAAMIIEEGLLPEVLKRI